jgi:hypothetical protein
VTLWFIIGGLYDIMYMYRRLRTEQVDDRDDGRFFDHRNVDEELPPENEQTG